jgi:3-oxoacyl-[acyl-carrier protein] reductase
MMELSLAGRHALVCGGSAGIGRAAALALAELGAEITVLARSAGRLDDAVAALRVARCARRARRGGGPR